MEFDCRGITSLVDGESDESDEWDLDESEKDEWECPSDLRYDWGLQTDAAECIFGQRVGGKGGQG
jgi:hypothetical protein